MPSHRFVPPRVAACREPRITTTAPIASRVALVANPLGSNPAPIAAAPAHGSPYLDYTRVLTVEGGVLITYKDIDTRWRWHLWRAFAWSLATAVDYGIAFHLSPLDSELLNGLGWILAAGLNLLIVWSAISIRRRIEVRADCLILDGVEVFWRRHLEGGWPELRPKDGKEEIFILCGVYGTRFVEFGTLRRFDEFDRQPETFAAHFTMALEQLWDAGTNNKVSRI